MKKSLAFIAMVALTGAGSAACATKGFVNNQVGAVSSKVDTLRESLEATQERTRQNETRIGEVDQRVGVVATSAERANSAAVETASKRIMYEVVLSENQGNFTFGKSVLPDAAKTRIDELVTQIKSDPKGAYFEIEGHTDNVGDAMYNEKLGLERAEAVKRYLYEQHQIPLHRMNVVSYGETKPSVENNNRDNRAQNRRVVLRILG
jgi:outer membrane protein OmpA-like peptidoglycan-associated protein